MGNCSNSITSNRLFNTLIKGITRFFNQSRNFRGNNPYRNGDRGIAVKTVNFRTTINTNDITFRKFAGTGNSVYNFTVNRYTDVSRETIQAFESRSCAMLCYSPSGYFVQLLCSNSRFYHLADCIQRQSYDPASFAHAAYFTFGLQKNHYLPPSRLSLTSAYTLSIACRPLISL
ncbi:hypothetical protein SDC9_151410 [bioreactor metagenome]|uniref:Uncharacterized protein n=1 Tax=bioreactor metagenome TaxID=1076179 RepID=A0A645EUK3_9ZZZZ